MKEISFFIYVRLHIRLLSIYFRYITDILKHVGKIEIE